MTKDTHPPHTHTHIVPEQPVETNHLFYLENCKLQDFKNNLINLQMNNLLHSSNFRISGKQKELYFN